jgi:DNA-binding transcriptional LysR family regulator
MIKELHRMAVFVEVVEHGSFSKAATTLGLGKSIVSAHVAALEKRIGAQLLTRSTRALSLTQEGTVFYENCRRMVTAGEDAFATVELHRASVSGTIRLTSSYNVGVSFLIARLVRFRQAHPEVTFDLVLEDSVSHVIEERFDLAGSSRATCRTPASLRPNSEHAECSCARRRRSCRPVPRSRSRMTFPSCRGSRSCSYLTLRSCTWCMGGPDSGSRWPLHDTIKTHSGIAAREFVRCGAGVGLLPDYAVDQDILRGDLVRILPAWNEAHDRPISAVFPESRSVADSRAAADRFPEGVVG